jgi:Rhs element Vgr protein
MDASQQVSSAVARSWNAHQQTMEEAVANTTSAIENGNISGKKLAEVFGSQPLTLQHGGQADPPELQAWADAQLLWSRMASMNGEICLPGTAIPKPGQMMELSGLGDRFNGPTFISEVHHQIKSGTWETRIGIGLNTELLRPLQAPSQSTIAELVPAISGLQIGKVTQLEGDPTGHERIRVNIPLISQNGEGIWARLGSLDAGNNRGVVFRPEIGDEVIVGFINDDPRDAIVLGLLHSAAAPAPFPADDNNPQKGIVTRNGLRFIFNDEQKLVNLQTPAGHQVELNENTGTLTLRDQTGNQITLHSDGITLDSQKDLNLQAVGKVKVNGLIIELNASAELKAEGSASAELSSSGQTTIKGALININ